MKFISKFFGLKKDNQVCECSMCKGDLDVYDDFKIKHLIGFGSVRDGDTLDLKLCNSCLDSLVDFLVEKCETTPVKEAD